MEQNEILEETRRTNELLRGQLLWMRAAAALLGRAAGSRGGGAWAIR